MNITTAVTKNGLNWFAESQLSWGCFNYVTVAYVLPVNCVIGFCENLTILYVLYRLKTGIGESARFYYAILAIFNINVILVQQLSSGWATIGIRFATQSRFFLSLPLYNVWFCKLYTCFYMPFTVLLMWSYVLFNVERVFAIASPLRAKSLFTIRRNLLYLVILAILGIALMLYKATLQEIVHTLDVIGEIQCLPSSTSLANTILSQFISNAMMYTLPPAPSLLLGIILLVVIRRQLNARSHLMNGTKQSSANSNSAAITGALVVITMEIVHAVINLPGGIFGCFFFMYAFIRVVLLCAH